LAPGPAANWIRGTGAIAVAGTLATYYNDLKTGVADGTLTLASGAYSLRLHEVVGYMSKVRLGAHFVGGLAINLDIWKSLSADVQQVFREVGTDFTTLLAERIQKRGEFALEKMREGGLKVTVLADRERQRWAEMIPNTAGTWTSVHESRGLPARQVVATYIDLLRSAGTELPRDWSRE
jgi:TRAP-type C4-dicarboxylate transport system substrate-binding protein